MPVHVAHGREARLGLREVVQARGHVARQAQTVGPLDQAKGTRRGWLAVEGRHGPVEKLDRLGHLPRGQPQLAQQAPYLTLPGAFGGRQALEQLGGLDVAAGPAEGPRREVDVVPGA